MRLFQRITVRFVVVTICFVATLSTSVSYADVFPLKRTDGALATTVTMLQLGITIEYEDNIGDTDANSTSATSFLEFYLDGDVLGFLGEWADGLVSTTATVNAIIDQVVNEANSQMTIFASIRGTPEGWGYWRNTFSATQTYEVQPISGSSASSGTLTGAARLIATMSPDAVNHYGDNTLVIFEFGTMNVQANHNGGQNGWTVTGWSDADPDTNVFVEFYGDDINATFLGSESAAVESSVVCNLTGAIDAWSFVDTDYHEGLWTISAMSSFSVME